MSRTQEVNKHENSQTLTVGVGACFDVSIASC